MHSFKHVPNCFGTDRGSFWRYQWGGGPLRCNWAMGNALFFICFFLPEIRHQTPDAAFFALNFVIYHRFGPLFFSSKKLYLATRFYVSSDRDSGWLVFSTMDYTTSKSTACSKQGMYMMFGSLHVNQPGIRGNVTNRHWWVPRTKMPIPISKTRPGHPFRIKGGWLECGKVERGQER